MRWFISIRYLIAHLRQSIVCIAGVTISVTMFIAMTAMMNGFTDKFIIETVESTGHITIHDEPRRRARRSWRPSTRIPTRWYARRETADKIEKIKNPRFIITLRRMPGILAVARRCRAISSPMAPRR
jgi:ABC-type lipoprotein release transport system permease subunit